MVKSQYVSWNDIENMVQIISNKISKSSKKFSSISTISRGGLIPSRLLADALDIETIFVDQQNISSNSLFVDDIFDSGKTFEHICRKVDDPPNFIFVTLFARRDVIYPQQLVYASKTIDDSYIVFPWDKLEFENNLK
jgi:uncharacterized protein